VALVSGIVSLATTDWLAGMARLVGIWEMVMAQPGVGVELLLI